MNRNSRDIVRHAPGVRFCHWLFAFSSLLLIFSGIGFMPLYGRFYLNSLPGLRWVSDFATQMTLHYLAAMLFVSTGLFHLVYHWRRRETALLPRRGDIGESGKIVTAMLTGRQEPPHDKFLAEQRLAWAGFAVTAVTLTATGYFLALKTRFGVIIDPGLIQAVTLLHMALTFVFLAQVLLHLVAFVLKANRPLLRSMFSGKVDGEYVARRHSRWRR